MAGDGRAVPAVILNLKQGDGLPTPPARSSIAIDGEGRRRALSRHRPARGRKFAAADLIGIPWQILVGPKGLAEGKLELKRRSDGSRENYERWADVGRANCRDN